MSRPVFTLAIVASADGLIARAPDHPPQDWASEEEQALFFAEVEAADWAIMGRNTHLAADKPHRRRIIFSRTGHPPEWRRERQVWVDPRTLTPLNLPQLVADRYRMKTGLILGGTTVHDWFHAHDAIDLVKLTVEPVRFGEGLTIFSGQATNDPVMVLTGRGYVVTSEAALNATGTRFYTLERRG